MLTRAFFVAGAVFGDAWGRCRESVLGAVSAVAGRCGVFPRGVCRVPVL